MTESMVNVCEHKYVKENLAMSSLLLICILCYPVLSVGTQIYLVDFSKKNFLVFCILMSDKSKN